MLQRFSSIRLCRSFVMHFVVVVVVAPLTSLAPPISNNYTVRIASHGSRDPDRSEAGRSWRRADTGAAFASRLQEEIKENKRKLQQLTDIEEAGEGFNLPGIRYCRFSCSSFSRSLRRQTAAPDSKMAASRQVPMPVQATMYDQS